MVVIERLRDYLFALNMQSDCRVLSSSLVTFWLQSADKYQQLMRAVAVCSVWQRKRTCKIRYVSKFTAASRGPVLPAIARHLVYSSRATFLM